MPENGRILAFDLGTTGVKGALYEGDGRLVGSARRPIATHYPNPGWAEQRPDDWWAAICATARALLAESATPADAIAGLSFCTQMAGTVPVDTTGAALGNALIWLDTRSHEAARRLVGGIPRIAGYGLGPLLSWLRIANGAPSLSGKDPASKIVWLRECDPARWQRTAKLLDVKDYLLMRCTGAAVTTPDCAHLTWLMDSRTDRWSDTLLGRLKLDVGLLPEIVPPTHRLGDLTATAAAELGLARATPVFAGLGDVAAFALAAGALGTGMPHAYIGTGAWCAAHVEGRKVMPLKAIGTLRAAEGGRYLLVAAQETAGACFESAARWLGLDETGGGVARLIALAAQSPPGADGVVFHPWLLGERAPLDDPFLRGSVLGLSLAHGPAEIARAVVEGVAVNLASVVGDVVRAARSPTDAPIRLLGGAVRSDLVAQMLADATGRAVLRMKDPELGGTFGAMCCVRVGLGLSPNLADASARASGERLFTPDPAQGRILARVARDFHGAHRALRRWHRRSG